MKKRVLCFGDSNTWGYDAISGGRFDEEHRWTALLQSYLGEEYTVIEEGLCGRTAVFDDPLNEGMNGLTYLYPCMKTHEPLDYMVIMLGTNDCKERYSATPQNIADGMRRLIEKAKNVNAWREEPRILLVCPAPIGPECETSPAAGEMGHCSERSALLAPKYELCAREMGVHFWDSADTVTMNRLDFMHLDEASHRHFAEHLTESIKNWDKNCE
ncbi:MAG: SGNH/GDSL hydrolase family protein [Lachnospiraceae bacterium]|nr:SGNH/GDSL hydrolase family protein [Lachnospiraceae bacterium]